jgi:plastocyanin
VRRALQIRRSLIAVVASLALVSALGIGFGMRGATAQEEEAHSHPAHIHDGTCAELGDVVYPLSNVGDEMLMDGTPMAGEEMGSADAIEVEASVTNVQTSLADLLGGAYAINIHESQENIGNYIACGDIGGHTMGTSDLAIGLGELNGSEYSGVATLHDNGDGTTTVSVYLTYTEREGEAESEDEEEAAGTPDEAAAATAAGAVEMKDFAYNPDTIEVKVGDSVTWTNNDSTAHTVTQDPSGSGFQSGKIDPGGTFEFTFDTAGEFEYFCEFHPNMHGTVVVS